MIKNINNITFNKENSGPTVLGIEKNSTNTLKEMLNNF